MPFLAGINPTVDWRCRVTAVPATDPDRPVEVPAQAEPPPETDPGTSMAISGVPFRAALQGHDPGGSPLQ